jgi:glycerol-3-phosphate dehydrogenase
VNKKRKRKLQRRKKTVSRILENRRRVARLNKVAFERCVQQQEKINVAANQLDEALSAIPSDKPCEE